MASALNSVMYAWNSIVSGAVTGAAVVEFPVKTLTIPELQRNFKSVFLDVFFRDRAAAAASPTSHILYIKLGSAALSSRTITTTYTNTGENCSYRFLRNVTPYFNANFGTASSQTCQVSASLSPAAAVTTCIGAKLWITYEYDTSAERRLKTITLPINSVTATLNSVNTFVDTVPPLPTYLPEINKTFRNIWFEMDANEAANAATDFTCAFALSGDTVEAFSADDLHEQQGNCNVYHYRQIERNDLSAMTTTSAVVASSTVAARMNWYGGVLRATYDYDSSSASAFNSLLLVGSDVEGIIPGNTVASSAYFEKEVWVEEPGDIQIKKSGIYFTINPNASLTTFSVKVGTQSFKNYTHQFGSVGGGFYPLVHTFGNDITIGGGSGITLTRGKNKIPFHCFRTAAAGYGSAFSNLMILNYVSQSHPSGTHTHNKTIVFGGVDANVSFIDFGLSSLTVDIPSLYNFRQGVGFNIIYLNNVANNSTTVAFSALNSSGWTEIGTVTNFGTAEIGQHQSFIGGLGLFKQWPTDIRPERLSLETTNRIRLTNTSTIWTQLLVFITYHSITHTVSGIITGFSGTGDNIPVYLHRSSNGETLASGVTTAGVFNLPWYDNTEKVFVTARQGPTLLGRSDDDYAVSG